MAQRKCVSGLDELLSTLKTHNTKKCFVYFTGSTDKSNTSWCPDCVNADPVIERNINSLPNNALLIVCEVGDRATWKNPKNVFRTNSEFKLKSIPTLMKYNSGQRLSESECAKEDLIKMLFTED